MLKRRMELAQEQGLYRQVEYIESSGSQCIDTGYIFPSSDGGIFIDFIPLIQPVSDNPVYFGSESSFNKWVFLSNYNSGGFYLLNGSIVYHSSLTLDERKTIDWKCHNNVNTILINNVAVSTSITSGFVSSSNCFIFANNKYGTITLFSKMKLFSFKIYNSDFNCVRNFIPVVLTQDIPDSKCSDSTLPHISGTAGLWDLVEDKFYANSGTGSFVTP